MKWNSSLLDIYCIHDSGLWTQYQADISYCQCTALKSSLYHVRVCKSIRDFTAITSEPFTLLSCPLTLAGCWHFFPMTIRFILGLVHQTCLSRPDKASRTAEDIQYSARVPTDQELCTENMLSTRAVGNWGNQSIWSCSWSKLHQWNFSLFPIRSSWQDTGLGRNLPSGLFLTADLTMKLGKGVDH